MKAIGIIGGVSWVSTGEYYRRLNLRINRFLGKHSSAKILLNSLNFEEILVYQREGNVTAEASMLIEAASSLEKIGADMILVASNTTSKTLGKVKRRIEIPLLDIIDITLSETIKRNTKAVGLIGTKYVMEEEFYSARFEEQGISVIIPNQNQREYINKTIYSRLCKNIITDSDRKGFVEIIDSLALLGAESVILGCTEVPLLISPEDTNVSIIDSLEEHVCAAVKYSLELGLVAV